MPAVLTVTVLGQSKIANFAVGSLDEKSFCSIRVHTTGGTRSKGETLTHIQLRSKEKKHSAYGLSSHFVAGNFVAVKFNLNKHLLK